MSNMTFRKIATLHFLMQKKDLQRESAPPCRKM